ncbi:hypothetical protein [Winogradskyella rapida]|uniref:SH3 domain-containing protein n=1 Tax=Winogradskyella rapida TaxID=549701 RepID=A0ABW3KU98_9FLAO
MSKLIFLLLLSTYQTFSQNLKIDSYFIQSGVILNKPGLNGESIANFNKKDKCIVIDYVGYNYYKIKSKKATGFVLSEFLNVTNEMRIFMKDFEKTRKLEREKARKLKAEKLRKELEKEKQIRLLKLKEIESEKIKVIETTYYSITLDYYLSVKLKKYGNKNYIYFSLNADLGCASSYKNSQSYVKIYLDNDDIITFYHYGDIDCADFTLKGILTSDDISRLKKSTIQSIRLQGTDYREDLETIDYKEFFLDKLKCIQE